ncbi:DNA polymerase III subunits gamma and tau [hydrothermal vent metagenome]|uniref:DNA-directed DNA polymerase n=1 Tax=hydrothermal vent metagenome TaxID=652676 RepID=A0A3B1APU6_9ZZZZ
MSYQVLARKWRPRVFGELVGQEHVVRALSNALDHDRLHHAYLFSGTRGVGKTTLARIFAKSLNCERGVTSTPCGECSACTGINEGRFVDLLEVDAASRTKVDQTRELLDNVPYAPVRGRYKVYLIDEVHMFSDSSFNALLKTLEEPPPHVKFLLATTDPQKMPVTVLSRCLQFNLKRLQLDQIRDQLQHILEQEGVEHDLSALVHISQAADGSMRDALSLMDQAISFGGGTVSEKDVRSMLGSISRGQIHGLLQALADQDASQVMAQVASLGEQAPDFAAALQELLSLLHRIALVQIVPEALDDHAGDREQVVALAKRLAPEDVQLYYQIGLVGQRDLPLAPDPGSGFEMVLLRMLAFRPDQGGGAGVTTSAPSVRQAQLVASTPAIPANGSRSVATTGSAKDFSNWHQTVEQLGLGGIACQLANNCIFDSWDGRQLKLHLDPAHQGVRTARSEGNLQQALETYSGDKVKLKICVEKPQEETPAQRQARAQAQRQGEAEQSMAADPVMQAMEREFSAKMVPGSVQPVDE